MSINIYLVEEVSESAKGGASMCLGQVLEIVRAGEEVPTETRTRQDSEDESSGWWVTKVTQLDAILEERDMSNEEVWEYMSRSPLILERQQEQVAALASRGYSSINIS